MCCKVKAGGHGSHTPLAVGLALFSCAASGGQYTGVRADGLPDRVWWSFLPPWTPLESLLTDVFLSSATMVLRQS